uniref:F-box domain-containing protein n=1 Tax=Mycena chlorophos TaxID=658473 RepID=A0ABQ0L6X8_MYCCL|nr:predicted protein [Mycena chlorophos]
MAHFRHAVSSTALLTPPLEAPVSHQRTALHVVEAELAALRTFFRAAETQLKAVQTTLQKRLNSAPFPISALPHEILSTILVFCLPPDRFIVPSVHQAPLVFTRVNRAWRTVALATPQLWTNVVWTIGNPTHGEQIPNWLARAGSLDLAIEFTAPFLLGYDWSKVPFPASAAGFLDRVRHLSIHYRVPSLITVGILEEAYARNSLSRLRSFAVSKAPTIYYPYTLRTCIVYRYR